MTTSDETAPEGQRDAGHYQLLLLAAAIGAPVAAAAFGFSALVHEAIHLVWEVLPAELGYDVAPWWWPLPCLALGGLLVGLGVRHLPGHGGHLPIQGLSLGEPAPLSHLPGVLLVALAVLPLGAVLGPEAPLVALGMALPLLLARLVGARPGAGAAVALGAAGVGAALTTMVGSPLVAAVFLVEAIGLAGKAGTRVILPCLAAAGTGSLTFVGLGDWTGFEVVGLGLPELSGVSQPDVPDLLWTVPTAVLMALVVFQIHAIGRWVAPRVTPRPVLGTLLAALAVGACGSAYALSTERDPSEALLSGQALLPELLSEDHGLAWWVLAALLLAKGVAYGVSLGSLRGGPIFPALTLGAVGGLMLAGLPGFGTLPALAAGMAAGTAAIMPLPFSSAVLVTLLLGSEGLPLVPIVLIATVVARVVEGLVDPATSRAPEAVD